MLTILNIYAMSPPFDDIHYDATSDAVTLTDSTTTIAEFNRSTSDAVTLSDSINGNLTADRSISDSITLTDSVSGNLTVTVGASDSIIVTDLAAGGLQLDSAASDSFTLTDTPASGLNAAYFKSASDSITITDTVDGEVISVSSIPVGKVHRFPQAAANPLTLPDVARSIRTMQTATEETVPRLRALPATGKQDQIVVLQNGVDFVTLNWWDGSEWNVVFTGTVR